MPHLTPTRLTLARERRKLTKAALARAIGVRPPTVTAYESGDIDPPAPTMETLSRVLEFPVDFFYGEEVPLFETEGRTERNYTTSPASFRAHYKLSAPERRSVLAAGLLAVLIAEELGRRFSLPGLDLPEVEGLEPELAADVARAHWGLGEAPVSNMVHLLESKGVRVFRLTEDVQEVDAFCFWRLDQPYVVLNSAKSGERSRFDAAHELGHLLLHRHQDVCGRTAEAEANRFASAFLLPERPFRRACPSRPLLGRLLELKPAFKVSVAAMVKRASDLGIFSEWETKQAWIELTQKHWRKGEPGALEHEQSIVLEKIETALRQEGESLERIALALNIGSVDFKALLLPRAQPDPAPVVVREHGHLRLLA